MSFRRLFGSLSSYMQPSMPCVVQRNFRRISHDMTIQTPGVSTKSASKFAVGAPYVQYQNLSKVKVGDSMTLPQTFTLTDADVKLFHSQFYEFNNQYISTESAVGLGFPSCPLPFALLMSHCGTMSHVDSNKDILDVGYSNAEYLRPVYSGVTLRKKYTVLATEKVATSTSSHQGRVRILSEQWDNVGPVFSMVKVLLTPEPISELKESIPVPSYNKKLETFLHNQASIMQFRSSRRLQPGQQLLHSAITPLTHANHLSILRMLRLSHPLHSNYARFRPEDLMASSAATVALGLSLSNRSLFEVLNQNLTEVNFIAPFGVETPIAAITYIHRIEEIPDSMVPVKCGPVQGTPAQVNLNGKQYKYTCNIEEGNGCSLANVVATTVMIRDLDVIMHLTETAIPIKLFQPGVRPRHVHEILKDVPNLKDKVVCIIHRTLLRQSLYSTNTNSPLL